MPRLTLARIGLSAVSKASSVTLSSVMRTGTTRLLLHTNSVERRLHRRDLQRAERREHVVGDQPCARRVHQRLEHGELRLNAVLHGDRVQFRELELIGGIDLGVELDGLDRRAP